MSVPTPLPSLLALAGLLVLFTAACDPAGREDDDAAPADRATPYLNEVVDLMQANSINRTTINWADFRGRVLDAAADVTTPAETDAALGLALELLNDNHSFIRRPGGRLLANFPEGCTGTGFPAPPLPGDVAYLRVPSFSASGEAATVRFAEELQEEIRRQDRPGLAGWIVDLRGNTGGNMWPMLAGIGPLLGEGTVGFFAGPAGAPQPWSYAVGTSSLNGRPVVAVPDPYPTPNPLPRVALLLDRATVSSGEAVAIAFVGRESTRSFGQSTCGLSTANSNYVLSDGSQLFLTTAYMVDRDQRMYGVPVRPDSMTELSAPTIAAAVAYLRE